MANSLTREKQDILDRAKRRYNRRQDRLKIRRLISERNSMELAAKMEHAREMFERENRCKKRNWSFSGMSVGALK